MYSTSQRLADVIKAIVAAELLNEKKRQALAAQPYFEVATGTPSPNYPLAFKRLDQRRLSVLDMNDLVDFLNDNRVVATSAEQVYLFKALDRDRDGRISLRDFERFTYTKYSQAKAPYDIEVGMLLPTEVEFALADLFTSVILSYRTVLSAKNALVSALDYTSLEAFRNLDLFNVGYATRDTLAIYMKS